MIRVLLSLLILIGCSKHDKILEGERLSVFKTNNDIILNKNINTVSIITTTDSNCPYIQKNNNLYYNDDLFFLGQDILLNINKEKKPVCDKNNIYMSTSNGEVLKINKQNKNIIWKNDIVNNKTIFDSNNITDITVPMILYNNNLYVGSLADYFCKINTVNGKKEWCINVGTKFPFILTNTIVFIVGFDGYLYATDTNNGNIFWKTKVKDQFEPILVNDYIKVKNQKFAIKNGKLIK